MKRKELESRLRGLEWYPSRHGRRHDIWTDGKQELTVPRHREVNEYTAKAILKEAEGDN